MDNLSRSDKMILGGANLILYLCFIWEIIEKLID